MLIIADKKIPEEAKSNLRKYGELVLLETSGITEESISGHPDIFFCRTNGRLIVAPNLPDVYKKKLSDGKINFVEGTKPIGVEYPAAAIYNAVITESHLIHRTDITDAAILKDCADLQQIQIRQGFARCSLLPLSKDHFITSDAGIYKTLMGQGFHILLVSSDNILLPGHSHGFFGGTCGICKNRIFIIGALSHFCDGEKVKDFISALGYEIIELYDGHLFDGGSILFIEE